MLSLVFLLFSTAVFCQAANPLKIIVKTYEGVLNTEPGSTLEQLFNNYNVTNYELAYPGAISSPVRRKFAIKIANSSEYNAFKNALDQTGIFEEVYFRYESPTLECDDPEDYDDPQMFVGVGDYVSDMNVDCAWAITKGSPDFPVAVVDQFMDGSHTDLAGKIIEIVDVEDCNPLFAGDPHGYITSGAVAAIPNNGICVAGTGHDTKIGFFCVGTNFGSGNPDDGVWEAYLQGYKIINVSYGGFGNSGDIMTIDEVTEMTGRGVVITNGTANNFQDDT